MTDIVLVEETPRYAHVAVRGNLDEVGVGQIGVKLTSQTVARRLPILLDLTGMDFITSLGIGELMSIAHTMRSLRLGYVLLVGASPARGVLDLLSIGSVIPMVDTRVQGLEALGVAEAAE